MDSPQNLEYSFLEAKAWRKGSEGQNRFAPPPRSLAGQRTGKSVLTADKRTHGSKTLGPLVTPWVSLGTLLKLAAFQLWKYEWHVVRDKAAKNIFLGIK